MTPMSSAMPTAVSTESSENTMSSRTIWIRTEAIVAVRPPPVACSSSPSSASWISVTAFHIRNRPPAIRIRSRTENPWSPMVNSGSLRPTIHEIVSSRRIRIPIARPRPIVRARSRCSAGSRCTSTEMNTTLSMPSTISRIVRVSRAIHASGLVSQSMPRG